MSVAATTPKETFRSAMAAAGKQIRSDGRAQCPGHDGDGFNLAVSESSDGTLAVYCHSHECTAEMICEGLGIEVRDLFPYGTPGRNSRTKTTVDGKPVTIHASSESAIKALTWSLSKEVIVSRDATPDHVWEYRDQNGDLVGKVIRWNTATGKEIRQIRREAHGWICKAMNEPRPLYRLDAFEKSGWSKTYITEGEKAADAIAAIQLMATSPSQGSKSPHLTDWKTLDDFTTVVILPDRDEPGRDFVAKVMGLLKQQAPLPMVKVCHLWDDLPTMEDADDAFDWSENYDSLPVAALQHKLESLPDHSTEYEPVEVAAKQESSKGPAPWVASSVWEAIADPQPMREVIIEGLARRGEVVNIVASTKVGKSWMAAGLLFSVATGVSWLGRRTTKENVLLLDNELHDETIQNRLLAVAKTMGITSNDAADFKYIPVRGEAVTLEDIQFNLSQFEAEVLSLVVMDAKYRFLAGDENSNFVQTEFHNAIDQLARDLDCVIVLIHHSSKGEQGGKAVTDIGSGGGAQSRAVDCHLTIRPHEESDDLAVLDAAVRTFAPVASQTLRWAFPQWLTEDDVQPAVKQAQTRNDARMANATKDKAINILEMLRREPTGVLTENRLSGQHPERKSFRAAMRELESDGQIEFVEDYIPPRRKEASPAWRLIQNGGSQHAAEQSL